MHAPTLLVAALTAVLLIGCGGETTSAPTEAATPTSAADHYCTLSAELDNQDTAPTEEQLAEIEAAAPPEIAEDVAALVAAVRTENFDDPELQQAEQRLLAYEEDNCTESFEVEPGEAGEPTDATS